MDKIVVIGGGGHAKVLISVLRKLNYAVMGYTDRQDNGPILNTLYLGDDDILENLISNIHSVKAIIGIGKIDSTEMRITLQNKISKIGFVFPVIISPQAIVNEEVLLGDGTVVFDGVVVNSGTVSGHGCILNSNSTIEHDCFLGDNVHIAPGVTLSGNVTLGDNVMIGTGVNITQGVNVVTGCLVGAGATVLHDLKEPGIYVGCPARRIR